MRGAMKLKSLTPMAVLGGLVSAIVSVAAIDSPAIAGGNKYFCAVLNGTPTTFVKTSRGNIPMIAWQRSYSSISAKERCLIVSQRFQAYSDRGMLKQVATGIVNQQPVICAVTRTGESCNNTNLLLTLPSDIDRHETARKLLDIRSLASGRPIAVRGGAQKLETYDPNTREYYFSIDVIEDIAPASQIEVTPISE
jgi:hypothetical protein